MLVSLLVFESSDLKKTWTGFTEGYEKLRAEQALPKYLRLQPFGIELPGLGKVFAVGTTWASDDHEQGREWINRIAGLGTCLMNDPQPRTVAAYAEFNETLLTYGSYGRSYTFSIKRYTPKTAALLAKYTESLPGGGIAISVHELRTPAAREASVFGARVEHLVIELVAMTPRKDLEAAGAAWARALIAEARETDPENILSMSYVSLVGEDDSDFREIYGSHYDALVALKKKYDPDNVFKHAVPRLFA